MSIVRSLLPSIGATSVTKMLPVSGSTVASESSASLPPKSRSVGARPISCAWPSGTTTTNTGGSPANERVKK